MKKAVYFLKESAFNTVYNGREGAAIEQLVEFPGGLLTRENWRQKKEVLADVEIIVSGWDGPIIDEELLEAAPHLELYLYGAGSIKGLMTDAAWDRGIRVSSAYAANAIPVAEFVLSQLIFSLKHGWQYSRRYKAGDTSVYRMHSETRGLYGATIGIISLGMVARKLCEFLRVFDTNIMAYDPFISPIEAAKMGVTLVSLEELFRDSDVVSLHSPLLPETIGMISGDLLQQMKPNASFINTSRGRIINEDEMIEVLKERPDLTALLDVTIQEPLPADSPLCSLDNVVLTPHLAGSSGAECQRMALYMCNELERYLSGQPLQWEITKEKAVALA